MGVASVYQFPAMSAASATTSASSPLLCLSLPPLTFTAGAVALFHRQMLRQKKGVQIATAWHKASADEAWVPRCRAVYRLRLPSEKQDAIPYLGPASHGLLVVPIQHLVLLSLPARIGAELRGLGESSSDFDSCLRGAISGTWDVWHPEDEGDVEGQARQKSDRGSVVASGLVGLHGDDGVDNGRLDMGQFAGIFKVLVSPLDWRFDLGIVTLVTASSYRICT
ncbi:hypothetical protein QBC34DRAFT_467989 [Podospora aff. communis PSN243]|uniref:Uncharacterized protein n=1 Tax=Podospora aff. communis PSN243 TaxID=3040156 RepID=A0AAV9H4F6_9PEZI|nr:hypothetical protein QBC34DRAFT_467989 [Podospora aff. communis PSN243]